MNLDEFYQQISDQERITFAEIAQAAMLRGYKPKRAKSQAVNYVFTNNRTRRHIMKFSIERGEAVLKLKFYASKGYSGFFQEAVRTTIEEYNYKYTGCYQCGKCTDELEGYEYRYSDGRTYFRCGGELISLPQISKSEVSEIIELLDRQHQYYLSNR